MKRFVALTAIIAFIFSMNAKAQDYNTGIGFRGGLSNGLTIKHFTSTDAAIEGIVAFRWGGYHITGLYEKHQVAFDTEGLNFFYGAGGHIGMWDADGNPWFNEGTNHTVIGVDGIIGLEYAFDEIPFSISADWKPAFNIVGDTGFWGDEAALSVRFTF